MKRSHGEAIEIYQLVNLWSKQSITHRARPRDTRHHSPDNTTADHMTYVFCAHRAAAATFS